MPHTENWPPLPEHKSVTTFAQELSLIIYALIEATKSKNQEIFKDISK